MAVLSTYHDCRALVTGSTGFKGTWLCQWLEHLGARVFGIGLEPTAQMLSGWPGIRDRSEWQVADIRQAEAVDSALSAVAPEIIFHLAAQPLVRESYRTPVDTFAANVLGTAHVLEAARKSPSVRAVVVVSSDKCYANREWLWGYRESEALGGDDPYSASKACTEIITEAYRRSFSKSSTCDCASDWLVASGRAGNVIGGGDWAEERLIPDIVRSVIQGQPIELRYPQAVRPWQHVLEPLAGYLSVGARLLQDDAAVARGWNFGPSTEESLTVRQMADELIGCLGRGRVVERPPVVQLKEATLLKLDSAQAHNVLGWRALLSDQQRIQWTAQWYQAWEADPAQVWDLTLQQIRAYEGLIASNSRMSREWFGTASLPTAAASRRAA